MFGTPFYHELTRKYVTIVGTLFNNIKITRSNSSGEQTSLIKVPVTYAPRDKMIARIRQDANIDRQTAVTPLPVISFELIGITYDGDRKKTTLGNIRPEITSMGYRNNLFNPVPYNLSFRAYIYAKNVEDNLKILEQILPYFTPDFTVTAELIQEPNYNLDVPVILDSVDYEDNYDDGFTNRREIIWSLNLTVKGEYIGPVKKSKIIKFVKVNIGDLDTRDKLEQITVQPGLTSNGAPTSDITQTIPYSQIEINDNYGYVIQIHNDEEIV